MAIFIKNIFFNLSYILRKELHDDPDCRVCELELCLGQRGFDDWIVEHQRHHVIDLRPHELRDLHVSHARETWAGCLVPRGKTHICMGKPFVSFRKQV